MPLLNERYKILKTLNEGTFGLVQLVKDIKTHKLYACKSVPPTPDEEDVAANEIAIHEALGSHPNIVELIDHFEQEGVTYLVLEHCDKGDVYDAIKSGQSLAARTRIREFLEQLISAIGHCHARGVFHRDIKPENILIAHDGTFKLGDFGLATMAKTTTEYGLGTEQYMAPECFDKKRSGGYDSAKADIWAIGICLLNMLFGRNPFKRASDTDRLFLDFAACRESLFDIFPVLSNDVFKVLRHCLTIDPENRSLSGCINALDQVRTWTTDDEFEVLAKSVPFVVGERPPFAVPANIAVSVSPTAGWDLHQQFTPPVSMASLGARYQKQKPRPSLQPLGETDSESASDGESLTSEAAVFSMDGVYHRPPSLPPQPVERQPSSCGLRSNSRYSLDDSWCDDEFEEELVVPFEVTA